MWCFGCYADFRNWHASPGCVRRTSRRIPSEELTVVPALFLDLRLFDVLAPSRRLACDA
jgi:hypothetical protein